MAEKIFILELLSGCNNSCPHCLRNDDSGGFVLKYEDIKSAFLEIKKYFSHDMDVEVKLSGGEATLWRSNGRDILDVMELAEKNDVSYSLITNGTIFQNDEWARRFFSFVNTCLDKILKIYVTVDHWHSNVDLTSGGSSVLDAIIKNRDYFNLGDKISVTAQTTYCLDETKNISARTISKYYSEGVSFMINPLIPWGKGRRYQDISPTLTLGSSNKMSLGEYEKIIYTLGKKQGFWERYTDFLSLNNSSIFSMFNSCGKTICIHNGQYYYCMGRSGDQRFKLGDIGHISMARIQDIKRNLLGNWFDDSINKLCEEKATFCWGYGVCDICKSCIK